MQRAQIFFKIEDPTVLQKNLLESAIQLTEFLQTTSILEKIKKQKLIKTKRLIIINRELKSLVEELHEHLPEIEKPEPIIKTQQIVRTQHKTQTIKAHHKIKTKKTPKKIKKQELKKELKEIQEKLRKL